MLTVLTLRCSCDTNVTTQHCLARITQPNGAGPGSDTAGPPRRPTRKTAPRRRRRRKQVCVPLGLGLGRRGVRLGGREWKATERKGGENGSVAVRV